MNEKTLADLFAQQQMETMTAVNALLRAVMKQEGIDQKKLVSDLIQFLPQNPVEDYQHFLATWREVLQTNF
ncbi:TPA: hypothetical protein ACKPZV_000204 [Stenotrophomonas maltophilia]